MVSAVRAFLRTGFPSPWDSAQRTRSLFPLALRHSRFRTDNGFFAADLWPGRFYAARRAIPLEPGLGVAERDL